MRRRATKKWAIKRRTNLKTLWYYRRKWNRQSDYYAYNVPKGRMRMAQEIWTIESSYYGQNTKETSFHRKTNL